MQEESITLPTHALLLLVDYGLYGNETSIPRVCHLPIFELPKQLLPMSRLGVWETVSEVFPSRYISTRLYVCQDILEGSPLRKLLVDTMVLDVKPKLSYEELLVLYAGFLADALIYMKPLPLR